MVHAALLTALLASLGARPVVLLSPDDRAMILGPIVQSLQAQLADLPVELRVEPVAKLEGHLGAQMRVARQIAGADGLAVVWLELSPGDPVFVYVADPQHNRVLARSVDWDGALGHLEAVGLIVRSSVQALLAGQSIGFEAAPAPPGRPSPPVAPPPAAGDFHLGLTLGYSPQLLGGEVTLANGLDVGVVAGWGEHAFVALDWSPTAPFSRWPETYTRALIWRNPVSLGVGGQLALGRFHLGAELAGTMQIVSYDMQDVVVGGTSFVASSQEPRSQTVWAVSPSLFADVLAVEPLRVFLGLAADIPVGGRHYLTQGSKGGEVTLLTPWQVQPRAVLGLRFDIL